jgi:hypothetical protein
MQEQNRLLAHQLVLQVALATLQAAVHTDQELRLAEMAALELTV